MNIKEGFDANITKIEELAFIKNLSWLIENI